MLPIRRNKEVKKEFQEKLLENINSLYNLAFRMTGNRDDAGDLVQEAALRGFRFYHKFEQGTNFKAWLLTIARNIFINQYRKKVKEPFHVDFEEVENTIGISDASGFEEEIFSESVQVSIDKLPDELKTTLILYYVEEMPYKEIAKVMDCPVGTVMSRLHTARKIMKKQLSDIVKKEDRA